MFTLHYHPPRGRIRMMALSPIFLNLCLKPLGVVIVKCTPVSATAMTVAVRTPLDSYSIRSPTFGLSFISSPNSVQGQKTIPTIATREGCSPLLRARVHFNCQHNQHSRALTHITRAENVYSRNNGKFMFFPY